MKQIVFLNSYTITMNNELTKKEYTTLRDSLLQVAIIAIYFFIMLNRLIFKSYLPDPIDFVLNTLPNFTSGIIGTLAFYKYLRKYRNGLFFAIIISGTWLTIEEYYPIFSHNLYFDFWDIFMSWFGCGLSALFICYRRNKLKFIL